MPLHLRKDRWGYDGDDGRDDARDHGRDDDHRHWLVLLSGIYTFHNSSARFPVEFQFPVRG